MFQTSQRHGTSLSRAHNSSYSDILFHLSKSEAVAIPLNFSNSYFYDLLAVGNAQSNGTYSWAEKIRFGVTNGPNDDPDISNLQVYGYTSIASSARTDTATFSPLVTLGVFTQKRGLQDFLCFTFSQSLESNSDFNILIKGSVVTCPILWDYHAHKFITDVGLTQSVITSEPGDQTRTAITRLVLDLKSKFLWQKIVCLYPFVGGTSQSQSFNLKNTATYSLVYSGTVSHLQNGIRVEAAWDGFIDTTFPVRPTTRNLAIGVYTDNVVNQNFPFTPTFSIGYIMGSWTTSTQYAGGFLQYGISVESLQTGNAQLTYADVDPFYTIGRFSTFLPVGSNIPGVTSDKGGLWAMARLGSTFSYLGLQTPGVQQLNTSRWYEPFEGGMNIITNLRNSFGKKRVYYDTTLGFNYFTSSIYLGGFSGTSSRRSRQIIKTAFIGFSMSSMDLLYMSEIITKFNHSLNRE
ncbi:hypothetical protein EBU71_02000 [bacterium]|nr:hypothetical protein [Candidatus Elulimicrobium humile]